MRGGTLNRYESIWITGAESPTPTKKAKRKSKDSRPAALLRTLTARPDYAVHVKELKLPEYSRETLPESEAIKAMETAAAIVRCTPNLERFLGPYSSSGSGWSNVLNKALSGCISLKEQVLLFAEHNTEKSKLERSREFAQLHERWMNLETLVLQGCGLEPDVDFLGAFVNLPKLKNLMISNFRLGESAVLALQAIPASVESLRLENLEGLTGRTLGAFANSRKSRGLNSLILVNIPITRIQDLVPLFKIPNLVSLSISDALDLPFFDETEFSNDSVEEMSSRVFNSPSLQKLHWDVLAHPLVETALASSISTGKLPALHTLRAPSDRVGTLQAACKPRESISLASDFIYESPSRQQQNNTLLSKLSRPQSHISSNLLSPSATPSPIPSSRSSISSSHSNTAPAPSVATLKAFGKSNAEIQPFPRTLPAARLRAQKRIERARQDTLLQIMISEEGVTKEIICLRSFMGDVKSNVVYSLTPDPLGCSDGKDGDARAGGRECALVSFEDDVLEGGWKREIDIGSGVGKEVCNGGWTTRGKDGSKGRKEKKKRPGKLLHTERRKVKGGKVELARLF